MKGEHARVVPVTRQLCGNLSSHPNSREILFLSVGANPGHSCVFERRTQKSISKSPLIFVLSLFKSKAAGAKARVSLHQAVRLRTSSCLCPRLAPCSLPWPPKATRTRQGHGWAGTCHRGGNPVTVAPPCLGGDSGWQWQRGCAGLCPAPTDGSRPTAWVSHFPLRQPRHKFRRWRNAMGVRCTGRG